MSKGVDTKHDLCKYVAAEGSSMVDRVSISRCRSKVYVRKVVFVCRIVGGEPARGTSLPVAALGVGCSGVVCLEWQRMRNTHISDSVSFAKSSSMRTMIVGVL